MKNSSDTNSTYEKKFNTPLLFLICVLASAITIRILLIIAGCVGAKIYFSEFALLHDGWEYIRLCIAITQGTLNSLSLYNSRFFLGYPLSMVIFGGWVYPEFAGVFLNIISAAISCILLVIIGRNRELGWWFAIVNPSWLIFTSTVMSEGISVLFTLAAFFLLFKKKWHSAIFCAGISAVIRPVGSLLIMIILYEKYREDKFKKFISFVLTGFFVPILYFVLNKIYFGKVFNSVRVYAEKDFYLPFQNMIEVTLSGDLFQTFLQWGTLVLAIIGAYGLNKRMKSGEDFIRPLFLWHIAVSLFYLLLPSSWAFKCLDRFYLSIYPTILIGLFPFLPKNKYIRFFLLLIAAVVSFYIAWIWILNLSRVFPFEERKIHLF